MLVVLRLAGECSLSAVHPVAFLCCPSACWAGILPLDMVVGGVVHRGICLTAWLARGVSVRLSVGRACACAVPELAFGWACHFGSGVSCWRPWCRCGTCFVAPLAWLWL
ncbi:hypothetical protein AMECASPLE_026757 [Ameca splendens]|uniref:Secreted protein n=1 Tax=Ameca splendens TaxID=208324 RepID=A0ABV0YSE9_9TELE